MRAPLFALVRCLTAVLTVWCLGCPSFEVLLGRWSAAGAPAVAVGAVASAGAAGEGIADATVRAASDAGRGPAHDTVSAAAHAADGHACGCFAGHAVTPDALAAAAAPSRQPGDVDQVVIVPANVSRAPLFRPPVA